MIGRRFFASMIGLVLLFAALGPLVGGALFIPLSVAFEPSPGVGALAVLGLMTQLFGRAVGWIFVYAVGLGPAAATGLLHALWDAAAPERAPRAPVAAAFGGLIAYGVLWRLASLLAYAAVAVDPSYPYSAARLSKAFDEVINLPLQHAFIVAGAVAGFVCAFAANLLGLTMRPQFAPAVAAPPASEGR